MNHHLNSAAALATALLLSSPVLAAGSPQRGKIIAETNCAGCHSVGATGDSANIKAPPFRNLSQKFKIENLEEALAEGIMVGHESVDKMPEFQFDPPQIDDFLAYLKSINQP